MKARILILFTLCALPLTAPVRADDKELAQAIDGASQDLAEGSWLKAKKELSKAGSDFKQSKDAELRAQYGFYSALVNHQCADDAKVSDAERANARGKAIAGYEQYLATHPTSGGALNNLAQLYGQDPPHRLQALKLYDRAAALKDARAGVYELNRAKLESEMGMEDAALRSSAEVLKKDRRNSAAQELSLSLLEKSGNTQGIAELVRGLNDSGAVAVAIDTAVREIDHLPAKRELLLVALADALANPTVQQLPADFLASDAAKTLGKHAQAPDIGEGVSQLLKLYAKPADPHSASWWHREFNDSDQLKGWFRGTTFLNLARALGDRCRRAGKENYACAEGYYQYALEFASPRPEPNAFLALAQIYGSTNRVDKLTSIEKRYEGELFSGKGDAIAHQDKRKEYDFHLALGTMYGYLDKWNNPQWAPASAVYQLENAKRVADDYNHANPGKERLQFPAESAELLSDGYTKTGDYNRAARVRIEAANKAIAAGDKSGAKDLMDGQWRATLPGKVDQEVIDQVAVLDKNLSKL
jgi:hypothetical protein